MDRKFCAGLIQMACSIDMKENLDRALSMTEEAAGAGAQVVCLQELFRSAYFCQEEDPDRFDLAESIPGPSTEAMGRLARSEGVVLVVPVFERRASGLYHNSAVIIDSDGEIVGIYRKMHIPDDPAYYEKFYFTPGDLGFQVFETRIGRIGVLICWDQWYPEAARLTALRGADILFYPSAIGWHSREAPDLGPVWKEAWQTAQRGHAVANGLHVAAVNRVGMEVSQDEEGIEFWGSSFFADPQGSVLAEASASREEILLAEVDLCKREEVRRNWPFLRDRRIDAYGGIDERYLDNGG